MHHAGAHNARAVGSMQRIASAAAAACALALGACASGPERVNMRETAFNLAPSTPKTVAATQALLPKLVSEVCLKVALDAAPLAGAAQSIGLVETANPVADVITNFPKRAWASPEAPRVHVWATMAGGTGCTFAVQDGAVDDALTAIVGAVEARVGKESLFSLGGAPVPAMAEITRKGWEGFATQDSKVLRVYISADHTNPTYAQGLVVTIEGATLQDLEKKS